MFSQRINRLSTKLPFSTALFTFAKHTSSCPATKKKAGGSAGSPITRATRSGKCRMGFIPEEWFVFFHPKTGVSGPYIFGLVVANYLFSKEILVTEHEYYSGLSIFLVIYLVTTKLGPGIGNSLDKQVDEVEADFEKGRKMEIDLHESNIKNAKDAQWRAEGQKVLMDAKKENVAMQLEAEYRERSMLVYRSVRGRMDYHVKRYYSEARIHQRWMIDWILNNVMKSITSDFEQRALDQAIKDLEAAASKAG